MLFGMNSQSDLLLAVVGLKKNDVERFRNCFAREGGKTIEVYSRTGGGNRDDYPQEFMRHLPGHRTSVDDDFDCTYCTDTFDVPAEFVQDVANLSDIITHGLRPEFAQHLAKVLNREPTEGDKATAAYEAESAALRRTEHFMANGHTYVPRNDAALETALELAEANGGKLRSAWGILPLAITIRQDFQPYPNAKDPEYAKNRVRIEVGYDWKIDAGYWAHMQERFAKKYPLSMANIAESVASHLDKAA